MRPCCLWVGLCALGCADDGATASGEASGSEASSASGDGTSEASASTGTSASTGSSASADGSTSGDDGVDSSATIGVDVCGDGRIDQGEICDDGNDLDGDACSSRCQPTFEVEWTVSYDGPYSGIDEAHSVVVDDADDIWVLGARQSADGDGDLWLRRYAPGGSSQWTFVSLGAESIGASGEKLAWTATGQLVMAGSTRSATTGNDMLLIVLDPLTESTVWSQAIDGPGSAPDMDEDRATAVAIGPGGDLVVAGTVGVDGQGLDVWVGELTSDGNLLWEQTWDDGDGDNEFATDVMVAGDGTVYVLAVHSVALAESVVLAYADDGTPLPAETIDLAPLIGFDVAPLARGGFVVGGGDDVGLAVSAFDAGWTALWIGHGDIAHANAVGEDAGGHVHAAAILYTPGAPDAWAGGFHADGSPWWGDAYDNVDAHEQDEWKGLAVDSQGDVIVVGYETTVAQGRNALVRKYHPL